MASTCPWRFEPADGPERNTVTAALNSERRKQIVSDCCWPLEERWGLRLAPRQPLVQVALHLRAGLPDLGLRLRLGLRLVLHRVHRLGRNVATCRFLPSPRYIACHPA